AAVSLHAERAGRADDPLARRRAAARAARRPARVGRRPARRRARAVARRCAALRGGGRMTRYLRLLAIPLRVRLASAMAYRANFLIEGVMSLVWVALTLLPLTVVFGSRPTVAGWDAWSALIVMAYFLAVNAVIAGIISPSLVDLVEKIRSGSFDYVLLKPVDAQAMISASRYEPWRVLG